jgi:hypothetical protein
MNFEGTHMSEFICSSVLMFNKEIFTRLLFTKFVSIPSFDYSGILLQIVRLFG